MIIVSQQPHNFVFPFKLTMKDKIRNYFTQFSPEHITNSPHEYSYTFRKQFRKTLGSEEDLDDKITWNLSMKQIQAARTPTKSKTDLHDYNALFEENQMLKQQIKTLKQLLVDTSKISKTYQSLDGTIKFRKDQKSQQIQKLKKIIQKSYYSLKQMEEQISRLNEQLQSTTKNYTMLQKKYKILEFQKEELQRKVSNMTLMHKQEIDICNDRIRRLELRTQQLMEMIENDKHNWSAHMQELYNLKKFYSRGTSK